MKLPERIDFRFSELEGCNHHPGDDGGTVVLEILTPFTPAIAQMLGKDKQFYAEGGGTYEFEGAIGLAITSVEFIQVKLVSDAGECRQKPDIVQAFKVKKEKAGEGLELMLRFRAHFSGSAMAPVQEFARATNQTPLSISLLAAQQELFSEAKATEEATAGPALASKREAENSGHSRAIEASANRGSLGLE